MISKRGRLKDLWLDRGIVVRVGALVICGLLFLGCGGGDNEESAELKREVELLQTRVAGGATPAPPVSEPIRQPLTPTATAPPTASIAPTVTQASDRISIPRLGVDAPLRRQVVGADGNFGGGNDSSLVEIYDLRSHQGLGGEPGSGNTVVSGSQQPGAGSFGNLATLQQGDEILLTYRGEPYRYAAVVICRVTNQQFIRILSSGPPERLTLVQGGGTGQQNRLYVVAERQPNSVSRTCPAGGPP